MKDKVNEETTTARNYEGNKSRIMSTSKRSVDKWMKEKSSSKESADKVTVQQADEPGSFFVTSIYTFFCIRQRLLNNRHNVNTRNYAD